MKFRVFIASALFLTATPAWAVVSITQKSIQVPTSGTTVPGDFLTDGTNIWFGMDLYDGTTWGTFNADGGLNAHIVNSVAVTGTFWQTTQPVSGTFWQTTQPISVASLPLPTGAATSALQTTINTTLGSPFQAGGSIGNTTFGATLNTSPSLANGNGVVPTQGGAVLSATNGGYTNILQGNAALTAAAALPVAPSPYPSGAVPITASATGTTAATTATLTNVSGHTTYICGFSIRANATAAATGNATVTGTISGTLNFTQWTAPNASGVGVTEIPFAPCVPASAVSTSIAVVSAAPGTGGVVSVTAWGYSI